MFKSKISLLTPAFIVLIILFSVLIFFIADETKVKGAMYRECEDVVVGTRQVCKDVCVLWWCNTECRDEPITKTQCRDVALYRNGNSDTFTWYDGNTKYNWNNPARAASCNPCGSCGDSRYQWCYNYCFDNTCYCRPDLCAGGGGGAPPPPPPPTVWLTGDEEVEIPDPISLSWSSSNANSCSASENWSGSKSTSGSETIKSKTATADRGTYNFNISCSGPGGSASDSLKVKVIQVPRCVFSANPDQIILPQTSTLKWECQYCNSTYINQGIEDVDCVGSQKVRPEKTTAYTLTAYGLDGNRMFQAIVNIGFVPILREVLPR